VSQNVLNPPSPPVRPTASPFRARAQADAPISARQRDYGGWLGYAET
jgi:hypothetical protein